mmetsp:Transcript_8226/g.15663  ORF Transcript_8226/g.15663 Transcript_8226/m.15663 type:complete len:157 (+) Transcript_8226:102-572(+)
MMNESRMAGDEDDDNDDLTVKSENEDDGSVASKSRDASSSVASSSMATPQKTKKAPAKGGGSAANTSTKKRMPSVAGLTIPFRTVKKAMKLDPDIPIVQNEAAIMTTIAAELFLKSLAKKSHRNAKNRGRNTIRYEDVAEARAQDSSLSFLEPLLP